MNTPISGDEDIDQSILDFIKYAVMAPSADNSQPWRFDIGKESIRCRYSHAGAAEDIFGELGHASILSAGALQETIDHLLGLIDMQPSTAELSDSWRIDFEVPIKQLPICDALRAVEERHTNRFPYKAVPDSTVDDFLGWSLDGVRVNVIRDRAQISEMGRAVRLCSEARFNSKLLHEWLFSSLRWSKDEVMAGDGLDLNCVDLPPGGRAFMHFISPWSRMRVLNRVSIYKLLAMVDAIPVSRAPCLLAITGPRSLVGVWNAGKLLQRVWMKLNCIGMAVHPYYVITDLTNRLGVLSMERSLVGRVSMAQETVERSLGLESHEQLHMLLRIGFPTRNVTRSRRRNASTFVFVGERS